MISDNRPSTAEQSAGVNRRPAVGARVALNGWFLQAPATGTGQYLRQVLAELQPQARECGLQLSLVAPCAEPAVPAPVSVARPWLHGNLAKVEFEHITFPRAAWRGGFALAHVPHFGPPLFPSLPMVVTIHDLIPLILPEYRGSLAVRVYTRLAARSARRAKMILADSEASRHDVIARLGIPPERVRTVYLAADARFRPARQEEELARVRAKYHLPERFVLYLGGLDVRKNVQTLVAAFDALEDERAAGWRLVIAGRLPEANTPFFPDPRVGASDAVLCPGHVAEEDKPAFYAAAAVFAFPSLYEGFGLPPLEAMACGTPVLCAKAGSLPEVVGAAGILVDPRDVGGWTVALRAVLNDPARRQEMRAQGLKQAGRFSWTRTARETLEVYCQLINDSISDTMNVR